MEYQHLTPELMEQLSAVAPGRVFTGSDINVDYSHDEMPIYGKAMPEAVVEALTHGGDRRSDEVLQRKPYSGNAPRRRNGSGWRRCAYPGRRAAGDDPDEQDP